MTRPRRFNSSAIARKVALRRLQVEGVAYGNPQLLHKGRKRTAKGKR